MEPDFFIFNSRLCWWEARHFQCVTSDGQRLSFIGSTPDD
jgi:hypothetical protein